MMRKDGISVNDCHAEVLARRGLLVHLMNNWETYFEKDAAILTDAVIKNSEKAKVKYRLKPCFKMHLYISEVPCGDASMGF